MTEINRDMTEIINTRMGENKAELAEIKKAMDENKAEIKKAMDENKAEIKAEMGAIMDILKEIQKKSE